jgi:hypothetical protein
MNRYSVKMLTGYTTEVYALTKDEAMVLAQIESINQGKGCAVDRIERLR